MTRAQNKKFYLGGRAKINKSKVTVYVGQSTVLKVSGTKKKANWKTSNNKVATVKNGKVTAKKSGTAVITAKVGSKKYTCKVTVKNPSEKTVVMKVDKEVINDKEVASITNTYLKQLTIKKDMEDMDDNSQSRYP